MKKCDNLLFLFKMLANKSLYFP